MEAPSSGAALSFSGGPGDFLRGGDGFDYVEALRECLKALDEKARRFLDFFYVLGRSRQEVASAMHLTPDGVKTAGRRLRARLGECVRRRPGGGRVGRCLRRLSANGSTAS